MGGLLTVVAPLFLASTITSPGLLAVVLVLLGGEAYRLSRSLALLFGAITVGLPILVLGVFLGQISHASSQQSLFNAVVNIAFGFVFIAFVINAAVNKNFSVQSAGVDQKVASFKWFSVGIFLEATNLAGLLLCFKAAQEISQGAISTLSKVILLVLDLIFLMAPIILPIGFLLVLPVLADKTLPRFSRLITQNIRLIIVVVFGALGLMFIYKGLAFFV